MLAKRCQYKIKNYRNLEWAAKEGGRRDLQPEAEERGLADHVRIRVHLELVPTVDHRQQRQMRVGFALVLGHTSERVLIQQVV